MLSMQQIEETDFSPKENSLKVGDKVRVHVRIIERTGGGKSGRTAEKITVKSKTRVQIFEGFVIAIRNSGHKSTFTVRKMSYGVGVERIFPISSPNVGEIEIMGRHRVRRSKLYYLRELRGKAARLKPIRDYGRKKK